MRWLRVTLWERGLCKRGWGDTKLRFGVLLDTSDTSAALGRRAAFGFEDEIMPLKKVLHPSQGVQK